LAILKIARMGHPVLAQTAQLSPIPALPRSAAWSPTWSNHDDANVRRLAGAGPRPLRVVVSRRPRAAPTPGCRGGALRHTAPLTVLINRRIEIVGKDLEGGWKALVGPGLRGFLPRHIRYRLRLEARRLAHAKGFHARVVQHECDHLDGRLYPAGWTIWAS